MSRRHRADRSRVDLLKIWGPLGILVILGFVLAYFSIDPPPPKSMKMAAGNPEGAYYAYAQQYREILAREGFALEVLATEGTQDNLRLLRSGEVSLALAQGGNAEPADAEHLESLASLFFEPVWVFYRLPEPIENLAALAGRRVAVGAPGSGTLPLARRLLADNKIGDANAQLAEIGSMEASRELLAGTVDGAIFVSSPQAPYIADLLDATEVRLLSFRRHRAYSKKHRFLSRVILGEGSVDLAENLPREDISLLAAAASLVASKDLNTDLIPLLIQTVKEVHEPGGLFEEPKSFPATSFVDLPLDAEAKRYLEKGPSFLYRILPFRLASVIDRLKILLLPFITLLLPLFRAAPPLYRWRIRSRIYRWYDDLREIDETLIADPAADELVALRGALDRLEQEVVTEVSVPLSYMDEYYRLRSHVDLIQARLRELEGQRA